MASLRALPTARALARRPAALAALPSSSRRLHQRVPLPYAPEHGIPGFLSPEALNTVAVDWQQGVLDRLNSLVRGTDAEDKSVLQTLKQTAQDPTQVLAFNYASEALNNSFFLSTLSPTPNAPSPSSAFSQQLAQTASLGSFPALVSHFSAHVAGLHPSSGAYVWLVTDKGGNLGVVGTYAGGTVLVKERHQMGYGSYSGKDLRILGEQIPQAAAAETPAPEAAAAAAGEASSSPADSSASPAADSSSAAAASTPAWQTVSSSSRRPSSSSASLLDGSFSAQSVLDSAVGSHHASGAGQVGKQLHPLAALSVHPHCYLEDYGLWGRDEYVRKWWGAVDWKKVEEAYEAFTRTTKV
ncbi:hypothetical protein JCM8097_005796 [Rhodosporidiobolus ruineniae]